jgi:hypothetical protein
MAVGSHQEKMGETMEPTRSRGAPMPDAEDDESR